MDELAQPGSCFVRLQVCAHQPHPAIDVETHAAGRNHAILIIGCRHTADRKSIALVDVGHGETGTNDTRQRRPVHRLLERLIFTDLRNECSARVDHYIGPHPPALVAPDAIPQAVNGFEMDFRRHQISRYTSADHPSAVCSTFNW